MAEKCRLCEDASEYVYRMDEMEKRIGWLFGLLITTAISSFGTLIGVVVILLTK